MLNVKLSAKTTGIIEYEEQDREHAIKAYVLVALISFQVHAALLISPRLTACL